MKKSFVVIGAVCIAAFVTFQGVSAYFTDRVFLSDNISVKGSGAFDDSGNVPDKGGGGSGTGTENLGDQEENVPKVWPVDISFSDDAIAAEGAANIMPGARILANPVVKNNGEGEVFLFFQSQDFEGRLLDFEISEGWETLEIEGDKKDGFYVYGKADKPVFIESGESSSPVYENLFLRTEGINRDLFGKETNLPEKVYAIDKNTFLELKGDEDIGSLPEKIKLLVEEGSPFVKCESLTHSFVISNPGLSFDYGKSSPFKDYVKKAVSVNNDGNTRQWIFLKPEKSENFTYSYGEEPYNPSWIKLPTQGEIYVFERPLDPGESVEPLFDRIYSDTSWEEAAKEGIFVLEAMGLQAENLPFEINGPEGFEELLRLGMEEKVLFTELKSNDLFNRSTMNSAVNEEFEPPVLLHSGDNVFKKEIWLSSEEEYPVKGSVFISFSEEGIRDNTLVSPDGGESFFSFEEFVNNLPEGWRYEGFDSGIDKFVYEKPLKNGESSTKLITHFNTRFENDEDVRGFDIFVLGNFSEFGEEVEDETQI